MYALYKFVKANKMEHAIFLCIFIYTITCFIYNFVYKKKVYSYDKYIKYITHLKNNSILKPVTEFIYENKVEEFYKN